LSFIIRRIDGKYKIYINEKNRPRIKSIKWVLSFLGLLSSLFVLPVLYSFIIALSLFLFGLLIEKILFFYSALYVHAMPVFEIDNDLWLGMVFGYMEPPRKELQIPLVGLVFSDNKYARKFFSLLKRWNYGLLEDKCDNFVISIILNGTDEYLVYIYPNISRKSARKFFRSVESTRKMGRGAEERVELSAFMFTMKRFVITKISYFPSFRVRYTDGIPYRLEACIGNEEKWKISEDVDGFTKFNLKIKKRAELTREDWEYDLLRIYGD
jgi:hypothetical protein